MAKAKKKPQENEQKPKKSLAANRRRRRARANPEARANPPMLADLTHVLLPGFGAYGAVRVLQRIVFTLVGKKWPKLAKHAHAATGVLAFGGIWGLGHRVKKLAPFHDAIVMGSGVAAVQGVAQAYLPKKYSWLLADCSTDDLAPALPATQQTALPAATTDVDDEYAYLEEQLGALERGATKGARTVAGVRPKTNPVASNMSLATKGQPDNIELDPDLMEALGDEEVDDLYTGAFGN